MRAAVLHDFKQPLTFEDIERPNPDADEVLIQVEACGVCHSDVHVADGDWPQFAKIVKRPLILGHEIAGRVAEKGANVRVTERMSKDERVSLRNMLEQAWQGESSTAGWQRWLASMQVSADMPM